MKRWNINSHSAQMGGSFGSSLQFASLQGFPHSSRYSFGPHVLIRMHSPSGTQSPFSFRANPLSQRHISVQTCIHIGGLFGSSYQGFQNGASSSIAWIFTPCSPSSEHQFENQPEQLVSLQGFPHSSRYSFNPHSGTSWVFDKTKSIDNDNFILAF